MLLTKTVKMKWNPNIKKYYEQRHYIYTKMGDEFEVKVEDLQDGSHVLVDVKCDGCGELRKGVIWQHYINLLHEGGTYYCQKCASKLFGVEKQIKTKLEKSKSFYDWCYENLSKEKADDIILRWEKHIRN